MDAIVAGMGLKPIDLEAVGEELMGKADAAVEIYEEYGYMVIAIT